jgi:hypothetical protein
MVLLITNINEIHLIEKTPKGEENWTWTIWIFFGHQGKVPATTQVMELNRRSDGFTYRVRKFVPSSENSVVLETPPEAKTEPTQPITT